MKFIAPRHPKVMILDGRSLLFRKSVTSVSQFWKVTVTPLQRNQYFFVSELFSSPKVLILVNTFPVFRILTKIHFRVTCQKSKHLVTIITTFKSIWSPNPKFNKISIDFIKYIRKNKKTMMILVRRYCIFKKLVTNVSQIWKVDVTTLTQNHYYFQESL